METIYTCGHAIYSTSFNHRIFSLFVPLSFVTLEMHELLKGGRNEDRLEFQPHIQQIDLTMQNTDPADVQNIQEHIYCITCVLHRANIKNMKLFLQKNLYFLQEIPWRGMRYSYLISKFKISIEFSFSHQSGLRGRHQCNKEEDNSGYQKQSGRES